MLNLGAGAATVTFGLIIVGSPFVNAPMPGAGGTSVIMTADPACQQAHVCR